MQPQGRLKLGKWGMHIICKTWRVVIPECKSQLIVIFQCLKESYVKAVGVGISIDLQRIDFHAKTKAVDMKPGEMISDTQVLKVEKLKY